MIWFTSLRWLSIYFWNVDLFCSYNPLDKLDDTLFVLFPDLFKEVLLYEKIFGLDHGIYIVIGIKIAFEYAIHKTTTLHY